MIVADENGRLVFVNSAAAQIHGVKRLDVEPEDYSDVYQLLTAEGDPHPPHDLPLARAVEKGETVKDAHWRIRRPDGKLIDAIGTARPILNEAGEQVGAVLTLSDQTRELATKRDLDAALAAKDTLLYEVNHRVKNNLAMVAAILRLQAGKVEDEDAKAAFQDLSGRIAVLEDFHRRLYQTGGHNEIEVVSFLAENLTDGVEALSLDRKIAINVRTKGRAIFAIDRAVPLVLALNELLLNSVKHAFNDTSEPEIAVDIAVENGLLGITYQDNGCGLPKPNTPPKNGIGRALIANLSHQLQATMETKTDTKGFCSHLSIPLPD